MNKIEPFDDIRPQKHNCRQRNLFKFLSRDERKQSANVKRTPIPQNHLSNNLNNHLARSFCGALNLMRSGKTRFFSSAYSFHVHQLEVRFTHESLRLLRVSTAPKRAGKVRGARTFRANFHGIDFAGARSRRRPRIFSSHITHI
jgi:hypothetical protein